MKKITYIASAIVVCLVALTSCWEDSREPTGIGIGRIMLKGVDGQVSDYLQFMDMAIAVDTLRRTAPADKAQLLTTDLAGYGLTEVDGDWYATKGEYKFWVVPDANDFIDTGAQWMVVRVGVIPDSGENHYDTIHIKCLAENQYEVEANGVTDRYYDYSDYLASQYELEEATVRYDAVGTLTVGVSGKALYNTFEVAGTGSYKQKPLKKINDDNYPYIDVSYDIASLIALSQPTETGVVRKISLEMDIRSSKTDVTDHIKADVVLERSGYYGPRYVGNVYFNGLLEAMSD